MSTTFKLSGNTFDRKSWDGELRRLLRGEVGWVPLKCMQRLYPEATAEPLKQGSLLLLGKGSSRGVSVQARQDSVLLELMSLASEVDWDAARWLLAAGYKLRAQAVAEDGQSLGVEELRREAFQARSQQVLRAELGMTRGIMSKDSGDKLRFPVAHFELSLSREDLKTLELDPIMDLLVKQCFLYGNAYIAQRMASQAPNGSQSKQAHYSGISTLVPDDIDGMTFGGPEGHYTLDAVPLERVKQVLSKHITATGHYLHFPPIRWDLEPALLEALTGKSTKEISESLNNQLAEAIVRAPVMAFYIVAQADGEVDLKESQALFDFVNECAANQGDQRIFPNACRRLQREMKQAIASLKGFAPGEFQYVIGQLDHRLNAETAAAYKQRVYELAEKVAKASGGGFLGIGSKVNERKQQALLWIKEVLSLNEKRRTAEPAAQAGRGTA